VLNVKREIKLENNMQKYINKIFIDLWFYLKQNNKHYFLPLNIAFILNLLSLLSAPLKLLINIP